MAVRYYDDALVDKISRWVKNTNKLTILKPEETTRFFEMTLDDIKDKTLHLPLIAISRDKSIEILNMQKQPKTFEGFRLNKNEDGTETESQEKQIIPMNVIPIRIGYQLDIYTRGMAEADEYVRNFVFNFINYPKLEITLPYNDVNVHHNAMIYLDSTISDNSDIKEHLFPDQFVRFTLKLVIDDAYLFSIPIKDPVTLEFGDIQLINKQSKEVEAVESYLDNSDETLKD